MRQIQKDPALIIQTEQTQSTGTDRLNNTAIRSRLDEMLLSRFFNLIGNALQLLNLYSQKKYDVSTSSGGGNNWKVQRVVGNPGG